MYFWCVGFDVVVVEVEVLGLFVEILVFGVVLVDVVIR